MGGLINVGVLEAILRLKDTMTPSLVKASKSLDKTATRFKKMGRSLLPISIGFAIVGGAALKFAADFDQAMTQSTAIMGDLGTNTKVEFDAMRASMETTAREVAKTTIFSAKQAADSYFFLASAGLNAATSIEALPVVARFAQAGMFDMATATDLVTDAQSALGLTIRDAKTGIIDTTRTMEEMVRVSDVLVKANTLANATVEQFSIALTTKAGASLRNFGKSVEEGVSVLAAFADQGIKAQRAGTGLSIIIRDLTTKNIKNKEQWKQLGVEVFDAQGEFLDIATVIEGLEELLEGMSDEAKKTTLLDLGFSDRSVQFISSLLGTSDQIKRYRKELEEAGGITEEVANKQLASFTSQLKLVWAQLVDVFIILGDELIPVVKEFVNDTIVPSIAGLKELVIWYKELSSTSKTVVGAIVGILTVGPPLLIFFGALAASLSAIIGLFGGAGLASVVAIAGVALGALVPILLAFGPALAAIGVVGKLAFDAGSFWANLPIIRDNADKLANAIFGVKKSIDTLEDTKLIPLSKEDEALFQRAIIMANKFGKEMPQSLQEAQKVMAEINEEQRALTNALSTTITVQKEVADSVVVVTAQFNHEALAIDNVSVALKKLETPQKEAFALFLKEKVALEELTAARKADALILSKALIKVQAFNIENFNLRHSESAVKIYTGSIEDMEDQLGITTNGVKELSESLEQAADFAQIFGRGFANAFTGFGTALSGIKSMKDQLKSLSKDGGLLGGLKGAFQSNKSGLGGILDIAGNIAGFLPAIGAVVGPIVSFFKGVFGKSKADVQKDVRKSIGAAISDGLAQAILDSGKDARFFLSQMFEEGALNIDQLAEQIGNIFATDNLNKPEAIEQLELAIPTLIANFENLGETGQAQIWRIIDASRNAGVSFEGLGELMGLRISDLIELGDAGKAEIQRITEAAKELGIEIEGLDAIMQSAFAPETMESIAEKFNLTNDQVKELADKLGIDIQTDLERMAATLGLSVEQMKALGKAVEEEYGLPMEEIEELLAAMGISAEDLAKALDVDLGDLDDKAKELPDEMAESAENARIFADEIERAGRAFGAFGVVTFPSPITPPGFAEGGHVEGNPPFGKTITVAEKEGESIIPDSKLGKMGNSVSLSIAEMTVIAPPGEDPAEFAVKMVRAIRDDPNVQDELDSFSTGS